jgi:hypothetical protein
MSCEDSESSVDFLSIEDCRRRSGENDVSVDRRRVRESLREFVVTPCSVQLGLRGELMRDSERSEKVNRACGCWCACGGGDISFIFSELCC